VRVCVCVYAQGGSVLSATTEMALSRVREREREELLPGGVVSARETGIQWARERGSERAPRVQTNNRQTNFGIGL